MRLVYLVLLSSLSGCLLFFDDGGKTCAFAEGDEAKPAAEPAPLRNPEILTCQSFGGGGPCDPECGPCPLAGEGGTRGGAADLAPIPSWGSCFSECESLDETTCGASPTCRIVKNARCAVQGTCLTDFVGCFPTDQFVDPSTQCNTARDGETCSRSADCTAFHREELCPLVRPEDPAPPECERPFAFCMNQGASPGRCHDPVACDALPPACPSGTMPGVSDLCWSGACIPLDLCEPQS